MSGPSFFLYRTGRNIVTNDFQRAVFSETWLSTSAETTHADTDTAMRLAAANFALPFGLLAREFYGAMPYWWDQLYPVRKLGQLMMVAPAGIATHLNVEAPEAAFRLHRVGAPGTTSRPGRICLPILNDDHFTDRPHRRRVDVATLVPLLNANLNTFPHSITVAGRTFTSVIFHTRTLTWTAVHHYELLPNTLRVWQRWRRYDSAHRASSDIAWSPHEL